jgi:hypothetical protein
MVRELFLIDRPEKKDGESRRKNGRFGTARCARYYRATARLARSSWQEGAPPPIDIPPVRAGWTPVKCVTVGGDWCASAPLMGAGLVAPAARSAALGGGSGLTPWAGQPADRLDAIRPVGLNCRRQEPGEH